MVKQSYLGYNRGIESHRSFEYLRTLKGWNRLKCKKIDVAH